MPKSYNEGMLKQFTDFVRSKVGDSFDPIVSNTIVPTITIPAFPIVREIAVVATDADLDFSPDPGKTWKFLAVRWTEANDSNAANRRDRLQLVGPTGIMHDQNASDVTIADATSTYSSRTGADDANEPVADEQYMPFPTEVWLASTMAVRVTVVNQQAGDVLTGFALVLEYDTPGDNVV